MRALFLAGIFLLSWACAICLLALDSDILPILPPLVGILLVWRLVPGSSLLGVALDLLLGPLLATILLLPALLLPPAAFALLLLPLGALALWLSARSLESGSFPEAASRSEAAGEGFFFREGL